MKPTKIEQQPQEVEEQKPTEQKPEEQPQEPTGVSWGHYDPYEWN